MYDHVQLNGHELSYYNDQKIWCTGHSQTMINAYDFIHSDVPEIDPLGFKENTVNMLLILSQSGDEYYHEHFPELTFYRNGPYSIDTVKKGISKGAGVKRLQKELQLEKFLLLDLAMVRMILPCWKLATTKSLWATPMTD